MAQSFVLEQKVKGKLKEHISGFVFKRAQQSGGPARNIADTIITDDYVYWAFTGTESVKFENCYFQGLVVLPNLGMKYTVSFENCYFDKEIQFKGGEFPCQVKFTGGGIRNLKIEGGTFADLCLHSPSDSVNITGGKFDVFTIDSSGLGQLHIQASKSKVRGFIHITNTVDQLFISGTNENCNIQINNCTARIICLHELFANGMLKLSNVSAKKVKNQKSAFVIENSDLGKSYFNLVSFRSFDIFSVMRASLIDCLFTNGSWSDEISTLSFNEIQHSPNTPVDKLQQKEVYRQIKFAMNKQGDYLQEMRFHILEMHVHYRSLYWISAKMGDKIILGASRIFSNYGQRMFLAVLWMLGVHLVLFWIWIAIDKTDGIEFSTTWNPTAFWKAFGEYFRLLNPVHKFDDNISGGFVALDLLMRMSGSYFLYLIIRASRKFIKGS